MQMEPISNCGTAQCTSAKATKPKLAATVLIARWTTLRKDFFSSHAPSSNCTTNAADFADAAGRVKLRVAGFPPTQLDYRRRGSVVVGRMHVRLDHYHHNSELKTESVPRVR